MRCRPATFLTCAFLSAVPAGGGVLAGPWARDAGEGFVSLSLSGDGPAAALAAGESTLDPYAGLYAEYGLGRRFTLGAQFGRNHDAEEGVVFLRYTITAPDAPWQIALDGGVGLRTGAAMADRRLLRLGASLGRGFDGADRAPQRRWPWPAFSHDGGWMSLDVTALVDIDTQDTIVQAEGTVGLALSDRLRLMLQAKAEEWPDADPIYTLTPGAAWSLTDRSTLQAGVRLGLGDEPTLGLSLGLWHRF